MRKLAFFEFNKLWKKRSFRVTLIALLLINIFLLWYTNLSDGTTPEPASYKALQQDISGMSEKEKEAYLEKLYQDIKGNQIVNDVLNCRASSPELGAKLAEQVMNENPGVFEAYYDDFMNQAYLKYTNSLEQEAAFLTEVYEEARMVFNYPSYRQGVQSQKDILLGSSVFTAGDSASFSNRNIQKEAEDYASMSPVETAFAPSKGVTAATQAEATGLLLVLLVFLFAGGLIYEEKEKKLFYITRATAAGRTKSMVSKLMAMAAYCAVITVLFYGVNCVYFACAAGLGDLFRSVQSVAPYMKTNLQITVFTYLLLTVATKAFVLFALGALLIFIAVISKHSFMPYLLGLSLLGGSLLLNRLIPSAASLNWLKYLNFIGLFQTENLYGGYMNFNFFAHPVSRLSVSLLVILLTALAGIGLSILSFLKCKNLEVSRLRFIRKLRFRPHGNLFRHESYKVLILNRSGVILLIFTLLIGYQHLSKAYFLPPGEAYYQNIMLKIEGELTPEKEALLEIENKRFQDAFAQIERIDRLVASGEIDERSGEAMKTRYYSETAFYASFQRVMEQYNHVKATGDRFVYDTGYSLLFGLTDNGNLLDFILLSACILIAFSSAFTAEYQKKSWSLLAATARGRRKVVRNKIIICMLAALGPSLALWVCRFLQIMVSFPLRQLTASTSSIAGYREIGLNMPIVLWLVLTLFLKVLTVSAVTMLVLFLSDKIKNHLQTLFLSALILLIPLILQAAGLSFGGWFSLFPLYNAASGVTGEHGVLIAVGYFITALLLLIGLTTAFLFEKRKNSQKI